MVKLSTVVYGSVALIVFFTLASTIFMEQFANSYEYLSTEPCSKDGCDATDTGITQRNLYCLTNSTSIVACTNCNNTAGYENFLASCYALAPGNTSDTTSQSLGWFNNTHCWGCSDFGFRNTYRGLSVLIFVLGVIGISVALFSYIRR